MAKGLIFIRILSDFNKLEGEVHLKSASSISLRIYEKLSEDGTSVQKNIITFNLGHIDTNSVDTLMSDQGSGRTIIEYRELTKSTKDRMSNVEKYKSSFYKIEGFNKMASFSTIRARWVDLGYHG